jgi:hypothetical protein
MSIYGTAGTQTVGTGTPVLLTNNFVINSGSSTERFTLFQNNNSPTARMDMIKTIPSSSTPARFLSILGSEISFNDDSYNLDFRVESDTNANAIFLDASAETIALQQCTIGSGTGVGCSSSVNGTMAHSITNTSTGTGAEASLYLIGTGTNYGSFSVHGSSYSGTGPLSLPSQFLMDLNVGVTNGFLFATEAANAPIVFAVPVGASGGLASAAERLRIKAAEIAVNDASQNVDFRIEGDTNANLFFVKASTDRVGFGTATPGHFVDVQAGSLATGVSALSASGTLANPGASTEVGMSAAFTINGAGASTAVGGLYNLSGTYSGNAPTVALAGANTLPGTAASMLSSIFRMGNIAFQGNTQVTTTGDNVGGFTLSSGGNRNIGLEALSLGPKANATNIAVFAEALNLGGGTEKHIGGLFTIDNIFSTDPVLESAALIADNRDGTSPILLARDNGVVQSRFADGGVVTFNDASNATADFNVKGDTEANLFFVKVSTDRVGFRTASPLSQLDNDGSVGLAVSTVTSASSPVSPGGTQFLFRCDATGGNVTFNLPAAAGVERRLYVVKKVDASVNTCIIDPSGAETIDGGVTKTLTLQNSSVVFQANSTTWSIVASHAAATVL